MAPTPLVGWWIAHSPAFDTSIVPLPARWPVACGAGVSADADRATVAAARVSGGRQPRCPARAAAAEEHGLVVALREHLASKPLRAAPGSKAHTRRTVRRRAELPHPELSEIADEGREDDASWWSVRSWPAAGALSPTR